MFSVLDLTHSLTHKNSLTDTDRNTETNRKTYYDKTYFDK